MKKILTFILGMALLGLVGCSSKQPVDTNAQQPTQQTGSKEVEKSSEVKKNKLDSLKESFEKAGFKVGENQIIAFELINATNGYKFTLNDELIEIYQYDKDKLTEAGKKTVEEAKNGSISMDGFTIPVKYNDGILITRHNEHKDKDKILEVFNNFK